MQIISKACFYISALSGHAAVVNTLLAHKADINSRGVDGKTPLLVACLNNYLELVDLLCRKGADVSIKSDYGNTSLHLAVGENSKEITMVLLRYGATLVTNKDGLTPLDIAKKEQYADIISILENQGTLNHFIIFIMSLAYIMCTELFIAKKI